MAVLNVSGWESGDLGEFNSTSGTVAVSTTTVRSGEYAGRVNPTTTAVGYFQLVGPGAAVWSAATTYARFYFRAATLPAANSEEIFTVVATNGSQKCTVRVDSAGQLMGFAADGTTQLGTTGSTAMSVDTWYLIEVTCGSSFTVGLVEVKLNGVVECTGTGNTSTTAGGAVRCGKVTNRNGQSVDFFYDDLSVSDSALPGAGACLRMDVDGDGALLEWTIGVGAGSNWQNVDEIPSDGNTTYLLSPLGVGETNTCSFESTSAAGISGTINVAKIIDRVIRNAATNGSVLSTIRSGAGTSDSGALATTSAYQYLGHLAPVDPNTSAAWTTAALDAVEAGVTENSGTNASRCSTVCFMVDCVAAPPDAGGRPSPLLLMGVG